MAIALWCREITIPVAVFAVLVIASYPLSDVYSLAVAEVTPDATEVAPVPADIVLPSEPATATIDPLINPAPAREVDASNIDEPSVDAPSIAPPDVIDPPKVDAPATGQPVMAALETPDEQPPNPSIEATTQPSNVAGPQTEEIYDASSPVEIVDDCLVLETCVDRYLWQLYQRTPKEDAIRETTRRKVTIRKKGKLKTVTRTSTTVIDEDFAWKDPKAATHADMSLVDYVIGGVDRGFKLRLFQMLRAADQAGLAPGITSAFRDDYRQSIASGLKAADNRSYHGGSLRGGYGHGLAADIVSIKGTTRAERLGASEMLWKWVDDHGSEFGLGRPYLDRDPPHVAPIDGEEMAHHRPGLKIRQATAAAN
ncbi:D-alanyl-D-alanine carboxypeptidase family protein [Bradyrhizobium sp.]|uniref:D-alanyl-D-alanine carboxypeptidase family protein n=1 Tax=Bradyrhizobium sp. TaxID=376 RepID=UPI00261A7292|nr:D-alanyl-D-alanine carboxypeptidase family protein [Bradyrhizobium sp.]